MPLQQSHFANCRRSCRNVSRRIIFTDECDLNHQCRLSGTKKVLVQELNCIDALARVDVLCLDKTGTITEGQMTVEKVIPFYLRRRNGRDHTKSTGTFTGQEPNGHGIKRLLSREGNVCDAACRAFFFGTKIQLCFF